MIFSGAHVAIMVTAIISQLQLKPISEIALPVCNSSSVAPSLENSTTLDQNGSALERGAD